MSKRVTCLVVVALLVLACAGEASALVQRTFVSGLGLDTNPCSRELPCRTFAAAIAQTQARGEVIALDSAGYGPVTITKSISLIAPAGIYAGVTTTVANTDAIAVNAGANDVVVLKGLSITGLGLGQNGIDFSSGKSLRVDGVTLSGFLTYGIEFFPTAGTSRMTVTDSLISENGSGGIGAGAAGGQRARVTVDRTRLLGNTWGLVASTNSQVSARDSVATGNTIGFWGFTGGDLSLENCFASDNGVGIQADAAVYVAGTTVVHNDTGLLAAPGASIFSRFDNTVERNGTDGVFTGFFAAK